MASRLKSHIFKKSNYDFLSNRMFLYCVKRNSQTSVSILGWPGSPNKLQEVQIEGEEFRILVIPGHTKMQEEKKGKRQMKTKVLPPRTQSMPTTQDWTSVWPAAQTFKWSVVPLPVRQGYIEKSENDGIPPGKFGNTELLKIPNFLHLTPKHIKKHCAALKALCTEWPKELQTDEDVEENFPLEIITRQYVKDSPTHKDERGRTVTIQIKLSALELDYHARDKLLRLAGERYDKASDTLSITSDRCPAKKQNCDYLKYVLTALYFESWKTEAWEAEKQVADMEKYFWDLEPSKSSALQTVNTMLEAKSRDDPNLPEFLESLKPGCDEEAILEQDCIKTYKQTVEKLHNDGENQSSVQEYAVAVEKLLLKSVS